ncbi:aminotransferase class IV (chromatophore) [Paulinella micropora]|uniref:Aminotransferase class IV n=1 Tax=Paulinella micropora TaxID=1928728 RepID=A0A5K7VT38_9EUKA|nr:aminotransferase class IV [Paulinella micropora]
MNISKDSTNSRHEIIAWINGKWGLAKTTYIPLSHRTLLLSDGIFETVLIINGRYQLLEEHIARWHYSAVMLGLEPPPCQHELIDLLKSITNRLHIKVGALRLNWGRGHGITRGINFLDGDQFSLKDRFWILLSPMKLSFEPISAMISLHERRNFTSRVIEHKVFAYTQAIHARHEARQVGVDDTIMVDTNGALTCGSCSTLLVFKEESWITPPISTGCLSGIIRNQCIRLGLAIEQNLMPGQLLQAINELEGPTILVNSLGCRPLYLLNGYRILESSQVKKAKARAYELFTVLNCDL